MEYWWLIAGGDNTVLKGRIIPIFCRKALTTEGLPAFCGFG